VDVELEDVDAVLKAIDMLELMGYDDVNSLLAIKGFIGMDRYQSEVQMWHNICIKSNCVKREGKWVRKSKENFC
jgi:hypothetical protein